MSSTQEILGPVRHFKDKYSVRMTLFTGGMLPSQPRIVSNLRGKNIIVTGSNSGLGYEIALSLASMGANIFMACRNPRKAEIARDDILKEHPKATVQVLSLDTSSFESVRSFAAGWTFGPIHALLNNAGIASLTKGQDYTADGFETMYQTNFLSAFLLTHLLEKHLSYDARVVITSSMGAYSASISDNFAATRTVDQIERGFHALAYDPKKPRIDSDFYFQSKLMQAAFARILQQRFDRDPENKRLAYSWEPGVVKTGVEAGIKDLSFKDDPAYYLVHWCMLHTGVSVQQGAASGLFVTVSDDEKVIGEQGKGKFWSRCSPRLISASLYSQQKLDRLWSRWSADAGIQWD